MRLASILTATSISLLLGISSIATGQDWGRILEDTAKRRANRAAQEAIDKGFDAAEDAVRCVVTDQECIDSARQTGNDVVLTNQKGTAAGSDRFTSIIEQAPESTVVNGYVVNNRRVAVQKELSTRPPTHDELGVTIPKGARLELERTARQIAQYHPHWRIYEYAIDMPQADLLRFFTQQGLTVDPSGHKLHFSKPAGNGADFIDNLQGDPVEGFRIWRVPRGDQ